jgi:hypothetical protein
VGGSLKAVQPAGAAGAARQLPVDTDLGAPPRLRNVFLNSVQIGSRPAAKVQAVASPATKLPDLGRLAARLKERESLYE